MFAWVAHLFWLDCTFSRIVLDCSKKKTQWYATVASVLSAGNPHRFQSGYSQFGETGWWRLVDPITAPEYNPLTAKPVISVASKLFNIFWRN